MTAASRSGKYLLRAPRRSHRPPSSPGAGADSERPLTGPAPRAPALGRELSQAGAAARARGGDALGRGGHPRRPRPPLGQYHGDLPLAAETRNGSRRAGASGESPCSLHAARRGSLVPDRRRWARNGSFGKWGKTRCLRDVSGPIVAAGVGSTGSAMRGALWPPLGGAQPATLTFPRGGPGRAFHGISRTDGSL